MLVLDWVGLLPSMDLTQLAVLIAAALACGAIVVVAAKTAGDQEAVGPAHARRRQCSGTR